MYKLLLWVFSLTAIASPVLAQAQTPAQTPAQAPDQAVVNIDRDRITVSGVSAGAQMTQQLHIAYPDVFSGAALLAGGPFGCAQGSLGIAMSRCMGKVEGELPLQQFADEIRQAARQGRVGDPDLLRDDRVWIFHGSLDQTVAAGLSAATVALYGRFMPAENIRYVSTIEAAHNFPTRDQGNDCRVSKAPFIGDCNYDAAGELLQYLYGELSSPPAAVTAAELTETNRAGGGRGGPERHRIPVCSTCV